jgi:hypothetical protein
VEEFYARVKDGVEIVWPLEFEVRDLDGYMLGFCGTGVRGSEDWIGGRGQGDDGWTTLRGFCGKGGDFDSDFSHYGSGGCPTRRFYVWGL